MTMWFTKNLGDAMLVHPALEQLQELFRQTYGLNGYADDTALFTRHESEGRLHCEVNVYFSPATFSIATAVNATPVSYTHLDVYKRQGELNAPDRFVRGVVKVGSVGVTVPASECRYMGVATGFRGSE